MDAVVLDVQGAGAALQLSGGLKGVVIKGEVELNLPIFKAIRIAQSTGLDLRENPGFGPDLVVGVIINCHQFHQNRVIGVGLPDKLFQQLKHILEGVLMVGPVLPKVGAQSE